MDLIKKWNFAHALLMLSAGLLALVVEDIIFLIVFIVLSFGIFIYAHRAFFATFSPWGGYANWMSLFRWLLMLFGGIMLTQWKVIYSFPFFLVALCLDGLDGYLARKYDQTSDFGSYLDMETDAFFVAFLSTFWFLDGRIGEWILFIGFLRYLYVIALKLFKLEGKKEKSTRFAKVIAVIIMSALLAPFVFPAPIYLGMILLASVLTTYSFGLSFFSRFGE